MGFKDYISREAPRHCPSMGVEQEAEDKADACAFPSPEEAMRDSLENCGFYLLERFQVAASGKALAAGVDDSFLSKEVRVE